MILSGGNFFNFRKIFNLKKNGQKFIYVTIQSSDVTPISCLSQGRKLCYFKSNVMRVDPARLHVCSTRLLMVNILGIRLTIVFKSSSKQN